MQNEGIEIVHRLEVFPLLMYLLLSLFWLPLEDIVLKKQKKKLYYYIEKKIKLRSCFYQTI